MKLLKQINLEGNFKGIPKDITSQIITNDQIRQLPMNGSRFSLRTFPHFWIFNGPQWDVEVFPIKRGAISQFVVFLDHFRLVSPEVCFDNILTHRGIASIKVNSDHSLVAKNCLPEFLPSEFVGGKTGKVIEGVVTFPEKPSVPRFLQHSSSKPDFLFNILFFISSVVLFIPAEGKIRYIRNHVARPSSE